jgi:hypothetical protein
MTGASGGRARHRMIPAALIAAGALTCARSRSPRPTLDTGTP